MDTVFSHIIQKRFSQVNEDVATDALAYVLQSSNAARRGMTKLLRCIVPDLPALHFRTQQTDGEIRPDMWGLADNVPRVFVENKFWAGLTDKQPVSYLKRLAFFPQPTVLLVIAPVSREPTLWRELSRRLLDEKISVSECGSTAGISYMVSTQLGPIIALTSWTHVLSMLEHEAFDDPGARGDLVQLRGLCEATDNDAFHPVSKLELSDQRTPAFIIQLTSIVQAAVDYSVAENVLSVTGLRPQASWDRIGRYVWVAGDRGAGAWLGLHFGLWKLHGATPLWLLFPETNFGRAQEVSSLIEPWAKNYGMLTTTINRDFAIGLNIPIGEEKAEVIRSPADGLKTIATLLAVLPARTVSIVEEQ